MTTYHYRIADLSVALHSALPLNENADSRLFRCDAPEMPDISATLETVAQLDEPETGYLNDGLFTRLYQQGEELSLITENRLNGTACIRADFPVQGGPIRMRADAATAQYAASVQNLWPAMDLPYQLLLHGVTVLHAASVAVDGGAVLFTAPSGTGKSTQAALWAACRNATQLNGDKVAIGCRHGQLHAWGLPFCGTSGICRTYDLPVRAIAVLRQGSENTASHLSGVPAAAALMNNAFGHNRVGYCREKLLECLLPAAKLMPVIELCCTPDERAVCALENAMKEYGI